MFVRSAFPAPTYHRFCAETEPEESQEMNPDKDYCAIAMEQGYGCPPNYPDVICLSLMQELPDRSRNTTILAKITDSEAV